MTHFSTSCFLVDRSSTLLLVSIARACRRYDQQGRQFCSCGFGGVCFCSEIQKENLETKSKRTIARVARCKKVFEFDLLNVFSNHSLLFLGIFLDFYRFLKPKCRSVGF